MIPIVKKEIIDSLSRSLLEGEDGNFNEETFALIERENPILGGVICEMIKEAAQEIDMHEIMTKMVTCCCMMYRMLRSQSEADDMNGM
jgi:hypothetical protein